MPAENKITDTTTIGFGLVVTLLAAAATFGIMYQKVEDLRTNLAGVQQDVTTLHQDNAILHQDIASLKNLLIQKLAFNP